MARHLAAILFTDVVGYTALMGADEGQALAAVKRSRKKIRERVEAHGGIFREHEGDGTLSTFPSAVEAVSSALEIQDALRDDPDLQVRIGIHVGDVLEEGESIYGDGVNVAARVLSLAEPGGICVSEPVYDEVRNKPGIPVRRLGPQQLKNVNRPVNVFALDELGDAGSEPELPHRPWWRRRPAIAALVLVALGSALAGNEDTRLGVLSWAVARAATSFPDVDAEVQFTRSADGTRIAWAGAGEGSPVVQVQVWGTNVEHPLPLGRAVLPEHRYVWYDGRGFGLSERGAAHSVENQIADLSAVIEAAGLERFALFGFSGGCPAAIAYAALHPDRVTRMALYGGRAIPAQDEVPEGLIDRATWLSTIDIVERHWGTPNPTFRNFFVGLFIPEASELELRVFERFFLANGSAEEAARYLRIALDTDVTQYAERIRIPTLLLHRRGDAVIPYEAALDLAGRISTARLVTLEGTNHVLMRGEAEAERAMEEITAFLRD